MTWIEGNVNKSVGNLNYVPYKGWYHKGTTLKSTMLCALPIIPNKYKNIPFVKIALNTL